MIFESHNASMISFLPFSGGKFLSNCLSLSRHCCPQDPAAAEYLLECPNDYDRRLEIVLKTLPSTDQMIDWRSFEYGDHQLYGDAFFSWLSGVAVEPNDITKKLCHSEMRFFITDHSMQPINLCQIWKNSVIIRLINSRTFQDLCLIKKNGGTPTDMTQTNGNYCVEKYDTLRGLDWPSWQQFQSSGYDIRKCGIFDQEIINEIGKFYTLHTIQNQVIMYDVDQNYFDKDKFSVSMRNLYDNLGPTDFSSDLVEFFYTKYMSLHL